MGEEESENDKLKSVEEGVTAVTKQDDQNSSVKSGMKLLWCVIGLQISYLTWGVLQERIMTQKYDGETFSTSQFLVFVNRILALVVAGKCTEIIRDMFSYIPV